MTFRTSNCVALGVPDRTKAVEFYTQVLGFKAVQSKDDWTEIASGSLRLFIVEDDVGEPVFDLEVEDIRSAEAELSKAGFTKLEISDKELFMRDPFGYAFCISKRPEVK